MRGYETFGAFFWLSLEKVWKIGQERQLIYCTLFRAHKAHVLFKNLEKMSNMQGAWISSNTLSNYMYKLIVSGATNGSVNPDILSGDRVAET
jgi:hypothetical protein